MTTTAFKNKTFSDIIDRGEALVIDGIQFEGCQFLNCALSLTKEIDRRSVIRNVEITNCIAGWCDIGCATIENVKVDGLATNDLLIVWGATFHHVKFSGEIGKLKINPFAHHVDRTEATQGPFDAHRLALYSSIDWALDISEARFKEFDVRGIPAKLFKRDPETQMVVTRQRALQPEWRGALDRANSLWRFMIDLFLADGDEDMVLVAPLGAPKKKRDALVRGLQELRALGVAEPS